MRKAVYHPAAPGEAREAARYYSDKSETLADDFWEELLEAIEYARQFPERHHFDPCGKRRSNLKRFPYHFLFRIFDTHIRITTIRHNHRQPGHGTRRN